MNTNVKQLADAIVSAENPYAEFDKYASKLDKIHSTMLAREVNKRLFLKKLDESDINNNIEFSLVGRGADKGANEVINDKNVVKTASEKHNYKHLVSDSMFLIKRAERTEKVVVHGTDRLLEEKIAHEHKQNAIKQEEELQRAKDKKRAESFMQVNDLEDKFIGTLLKTASNEGILRAYAAVLAKNGQEELVGPLISTSRYTLGEIEKTASEPLTEEQEEYIAKIATYLKEAKEDIYNTPKNEWIKDETLEKIAFIGTLLKAPLKLLIPATKGIGMAYNAAGKGAGKVGAYALKKTFNGASSLAGKAIMGSGKLALKTAKGIGAHPKTVLSVGSAALTGADLLSNAEKNRKFIVNTLM